MHAESQDAAGAANVIALADMHDVRGVRRLHAAALAALDASGAVTADAADVAHLDTAALQVLIALRRALESRGRTLVLKDVGESVGTFLRNAGLEEAVLGVGARADQGHPARVEGLREVRP